MRRAAFICLFLTALAVSSASMAGLPVGKPRFTEAETADLRRIDDYLNAIHTMKGGFTQIDPNGDIDQGTFAISKPGRMRFEYKPPASTLIVSDGKTVAVANPKLKTVDRYPLDQTPLDLILGNEVDLVRDRSITGIEHHQDALIVKARSRGS